MSAPNTAPARTVRRSGWRVVGRVAGLALTVALVALFTAVFLAPRLMGGASLTVLTGSMRPTLEPGDVAVVRGVDPSEVCRSVGIGHIVTYMPNPNDAALITHRVVAKTVGSFDDGTNCRLITQGDANNAVDKPVSPVQVRGVFLYNVPKLGWVRQWAAQHVGIVVAAGVAVTAIYLLWGGWTRRKAARSALDAAEPVPYWAETMYDSAEPTYYAAPPAPYDAPVPAANVPRRALAEE